MNNYDDIINLPHHVSKVHPKMSLYNRSAQFAPFAALTGYGDAITETSRLTDKKIIIDDGLRAVINNKLNIIKNNIKNNPYALVTYFIKDKYKDGGMYKTTNGNIRKIDEYDKKVIFTNNLKIKMDDIISIKFVSKNDIIK